MIPAGVQVYVASTPADFRERATGLMALVRDGGADPLSGALYVFRSKKGDGRTWATIATLLQTAKLNDVNPHAWLTQTPEPIAQELADHLDRCTHALVAQSLNGLCWRLRRAPFGHHSALLICGYNASRGLLSNEYHQKWL